jgi:hypothetical protein
MSSRTNAARQLRASGVFMATPHAPNMPLASIRCWPCGSGVAEPADLLEDGGCFVTHDTSSELRTSQRVMIGA